MAAVAVAAWPRARSRAGRLIPGLLRWRLPEVAAGLVAVALIAFLIRPSVQTAHWNPGAGTAGYVGALQKLLGLPVQPTRSYAEDSLYWVIWYIGVPALLLGRVRHGPARPPLRARAAAVGRRGRRRPGLGAAAR